MNDDDRIELIKRNTEEVVTEEELRQLLKEKKKPTAYIGYAPTGKLHVGHIIPIMKVADFLKAGFNFKFLIADLHAFLDDQKTPWHLLDHRAEYYEECIRGIFDALKIDTAGLKFVKGTDFQLNAEYVLEVMQMVGDVTMHRAKRAASEVVRFNEDPKLGGFIYPLMQIEDVIGLEADVAYGGRDQRGIYMLGREILPKMGHKKPLCVFTPLLPGLTGAKMSASDPKSKIDLLDDEATVTRKVKNAECVAGQKENGVLTFVKYVIFPWKNSFRVERDKKYGGDLEYKNYEKLEADFIAKKLHPEDLKNAVAADLNKLLSPLRKRFSKKLELIKRAYPDENS